jgi:lambda repressor-like predicted transcriptional regulator
MVSVAEWMTRKGVGVEELERTAGLERKVLEAILHGRYTPSPRQRARVAAALGVTPAEIAWGHVTPVSHLYGHGPQFGRTP